jgi:hypothetical protein
MANKKEPPSLKTIGRHGRFLAEWLNLIATVALRLLLTK